MKTTEEREELLRAAIDQVCWRYGRGEISPEEFYARMAVAAERLESLRQKAQNQNKPCVVKNTAPCA